MNDNWSLSYDSSESSIRCFVNYNGKLYVGTSTNGKILVFDGSSWSVAYDSSELYVLSLCVYNNKLYAGTGNAGKVFVFDGNTWSVAYDSDETHIMSLVVYSSKLYAGTQTNGLVYVFDGSTWSESYNSSENSIRSLCEYNGKLYAGTYPSGIVYVFDGSSWSVAYDSDETFIFSLCVFNNKLYAGTGSVGKILVFDGNTWSVAYDSDETYIISLCEYNGKLYAGTQTNGLVYVFDGFTWSIAYDSSESIVRSLGVFDNKLYVGTESNGIVFVFEDIQNKKIGVSTPLNAVPSVSDSSLVGAWLNKETREAEDYSNRNNDGTATDMVFEKTGGKFNGSSSYIDLGKPSDLNLIDNFTISAWVNPISFTHPLANTIIAKRDALVYQYQFRVTSGGLLSFLSGIGQVRLSVSSIPLNSWSHVTLTKEGSNLKFYINGVLDATHPNAVDIVEADTNVRIGWDGQVANTYWTGGIKDLRVYSEVKSDSFIKNLFLSSCPESDLVFSCFDGLKDLSKFKRSLINNNTVVGKEMVFNGVDSSISVVSDASLDLSSNFTISCWVNLNSNTIHPLVAKGEGSASQYVLDVVSGKIRFFGYQDTIGKGAFSLSGVSVNDNKWHHIVGTFDGVYWITYVDGIVNYTIPSIATLTTTFDNLSIGKRGNNTTSGLIQDVKVYNSVKSFYWAKKEYERTKKYY